LRGKEKGSKKSRTLPTSEKGKRKRGRSKKEGGSDFGLSILFRNGGKRGEKGVEKRRVPALL